MRIFGTVFSCLAVVLNSIDLSSQSERLPDEGQYSASSRQSAETTARSRSRSPTLMQTFPRVLGFRFEDLAFIRLRPHSNPNRVFELRRYVFPLDKPIRLRKNDQRQSAMPMGEQIVLSTSDGDVCAMLDKKSSKNTILRAICTLSHGRQKRAKINMNSGEVELMTTEEMAACPVFTKDSVVKGYEVFRLGSHSDSLRDEGHHPDSSQQPAGTTARSRSRSPSLRQTFPRVLGFRFEDLAFIRLRPYSNPNRVFELRRYIFPPDKPIRLRKNNFGQTAMPRGERIVLSTSNGDVCAILDKKSTQNTILRAICTLDPGHQNRAKINMYSGEVEAMTADEIGECPVSTHEAVTKSYRIFRVNHDLITAAANI